MKRIMFLLALVLLLGYNAVAQPAPTIRYVDFKVYDPVYVGIDKGFFDKYGVGVKLYGSILAGPTAIQAVASGKCEAGLSSTMAIINANAAGLPIQGVTDIQSAVQGQPLEEYFVKDSSPIKSIKDLKGKSFAVNLWKSSFHYTALMALNQNGMKPEDVKFSLLPFDKQVVAIQAGQVDVVGLMEPYSSYLRAQGGYRVLFDAHDIFGNKQFCIHFVNRVWAEAHPKETEAFVSGIVDSINWIEKNQEEASKIIAKYTGVDAKYIPPYHFQKNGAVIMEDINFWIDYMKKSGDLSVGWLDAADIGTNKYNKEIH